MDVLDREIVFGSDKDRAGGDHMQGTRRADVDIVALADFDRCDDHTWCVGIVGNRRDGDRFKRFHDCRIAMFDRQRIAGHRQDANKLAVFGDVCRITEDADVKVGLITVSDPIATIVSHDAITCELVSDEVHTGGDDLARNKHHIGAFGRA